MVEGGRIDPRFARVVKALTRKPSVTYGGGTGFGSDALKFRGKLFAFLSSKGAFVAKLPADRVSELVRLGRGEHFEPAPGRVMREWIAVNGGSEQWMGLAREALLFLAGRPRAGKDGGA